jgi:2-polyprenyl-6-methoxyphenol hydroxylase-like FAD-dependent oxidoreductase
MTAGIDTEALIVGGGPVGLGLALDLAWRGCRSTLVERDAGTATVMLAKANGLHERTMEMCRRWGIAQLVEKHGFPQEHPGDSVYCTALDGFYIGRSFMPSTLERPVPLATPQKRLRCPQYSFDPLLADAVKEKGLTKFLYGHTFERLEQETDYVKVHLRTAAGKTMVVRTGYLIGCDGAGSSVRQSLGIGFHGTLLDYSLSAMLRIPGLQQKINFGRRGERYLLLGPEGTWGIMTSVDGHDIWRFTIVGAQEKLDLDTYDISADIRRALGSIDLQYEMLRVVPWRRSQCAAESFGSGRVFLAGDSAHTTSPTGGHGMNTGFGDISDLGWMLEAKLQGWAGAHLLDAYGVERRPVAIRNSASSTANYRGWIDKTGYEQIATPGPQGEAARTRIGAALERSLHSEWNSLGIDLGYRYDPSPIIVPDGSPTTADDPSDYVPTSRPGHRAPHAWLADGRSILDLFGRGFVLLRIDAPSLEVGVLQDAARRISMPFKIVDVSGSNIRELYPRQLVLVRPDGQVAWRSDALPADSVELLDIVRGAAPRHFDEHLPL